MPILILCGYESAKRAGLVPDWGTVLKNPLRSCQSHRVQADGGTVLMAASCQNEGPKIGSPPFNERGLM